MVNGENGRTYPNEREQRVIALVAQGLKNKEVASEIAAKKKELLEGAMLAGVPSAVRNENSWRDMLSDACDAI